VIPDRLRRVITKINPPSRAEYVKTGLPAFYRKMRKNSRLPFHTKIYITKHEIFQLYKHFLEFLVDFLY